MAKIDYEQLRLKLSRSPQIKRIITEKAVKIVNEAKTRLLEEFTEHPVTQELRNGADGDNITNTLDGYGNLFSFIGFYNGDDPTEPVENSLEKNVKIIKTPQDIKIYKNGRVQYTFKVQMPSKGELERITPYPDKWRSQSWIFDIEKGIYGLESYLYDENFEKYEQSRSTTGLQAKTQDGTEIIIRGTNRSKSIPYLSELLKDFIKRIKG